MNKTIYDCIIIGSGPAGLTAAIYMARAGYKTAVIAGEPGGMLNKIYQLENYPGFEQISGYELSDKIINQCTNLNIEFIFDFIKYINKICTNNGIIYELFNNDNLSNNANYYAKTIIEAVGTSPKYLNINTESEFLYKKIHFCAMCDGHFYKNKNVVIIGGGNSAFDSALYLSTLCKSVTIIHRRNEFRAEKYLIEKAKTKNNIQYIFNAEILQYNSLNNKIQIQYNDKNLQKINTICTDGIFYALGFTQNIIEKKFNLKEGYFEAGDCITNAENHQVIIAAADGAKAAINTIKYLK